MGSDNSPIKALGNLQTSTPKQKQSQPIDSDSSDDGLGDNDEFHRQKCLPDVYVEVSEGKVSEKSKVKGRKIYKKLHYCPYCDSRQQQIIRHCILKHSQMPEVTKIVEAGRNNDLRSRLTLLLKYRGNFLHNISVLKEKRGNLVVVKRPDDEQTDASRYLPCPSCAGFFSKFDLWKHKCVGQACSRKEKSSHSLAREARVLLQSVLETENIELKKVLAAMIDDEVTAAVKADRLILKYANDQLELHDNEKPHLVRNKARNLGRLLIHIRKSNTELEQCDLENLLIPVHFDLIVDSVKQLASQGKKKATSLPLKLGQEIQTLIAILMGESIRRGDDALKDSCERFSKLYDADWSRRVSLKARKTLYDARLNKADVIPAREDVVTFAKAIHKESDESAKEFVEAPGKKTGRRLSEALLTEIILFNKRRGGEAARLELRVYKEAVDRWEKINYDSELFCSLPEDQKELARHHFRCQTIGKKGRHVPIVMTLGMKSKVDLLVRHREEIGHTELNKYVFGIPGHESHLRSWEILRSLCTKFGTGKLTSTSLRRYLATTLQVLDLSSQEIGKKRNDV